MLDQIPDANEMIALVGQTRYDRWQELCAAIDKKYDMEHIWNNGGKAWKYEYKYRKGGKTLCALYAKENSTDFMIIFGKNEREKFEMNRGSYSSAIQMSYDEAKTFHDGKWVMFEFLDTAIIDELVKLLEIKRSPNIK